MGKIITVASSKGGGGKTLLCCVLAPALAAKGYSVGVVDSDPNQTFTAWYAGYTGTPFRSQSEVRDVPVVDLAQGWAEELDVVIIDTAGFGNLTAAAAMGCADQILVPCMPDRGSTREASKTIEKAASLARAARRAIPASIVLSQWRDSGVAERAAIQDLVDYAVPGILSTSIPDRAAMRQMSFDSRAISAGAISATIDRLIAELVEKGAVPDLAPTKKKTRKSS